MNKRILTASIIILSLAVYINLFPFHEVVPLKKPFADFPLAWRGWNGSVYYFDDVILDKLRVSEYVMREYKKGDDRFTLYIGYYSSQKEGAQIHSPKHCLPGGGWFKLSERKRNIIVDGLGDVNFIEAIYKKGNVREVFVYWYKMKDVYITNEYILKLYMVLNSLRYGRNDAAFIRISAPVLKDIEATEYSTEKILNDFLPLIEDYLPE